MDTDIPIEEIRIKVESNIEDYYASEDWTRSDPCEKMIKVEIIEPSDSKSNNLNLRCTLCDVMFVNQNELNIHRMIHSDNHHCFVCNEFIKNKFRFVGHVRKHMCLRPFQCPDCDRSFASSRETKLHHRVHSNDKPYMCTECGKTFKNLPKLKDHEIAHTGEKRFKCKVK